VKQAVALTAVALALINLGLAWLIVGLAGARAVRPPDWIAALILALGLVAAVGAVGVWRQYFRSIRSPH
jgi:hypothetical protein